MADLRIGNEYGTFEELMVAISAYEKANFVNFYKRNSRTIDGMKKRAKNRKFNPAIEYTELDFCCIHGGRNPKSKSRGQRPSQR